MEERFPMPECIKEDCLRFFRDETIWGTEQEHFTMRVYLSMLYFCAVQGSDRAVFRSVKEVESEAKTLFGTGN